MQIPSTALVRSDTGCIGGGAWADVFRDHDGAAVKLFRRTAAAPNLAGTMEERNTIIRAVWDSEVSAYERASQKPGLSRFLVPYFGRRVVAKVSDEEGVDISGEYLLDCAYSIAFVPGEARKIGELLEHPLFGQIDAYLDELCDAGICSTTDGSVFIPGLEAPFSLIDVGTWEAAADLAYAITAKGSLPDNIRARYTQRATT